MTVSLSLLAGAGWQFFDDNGNPLSGGLLYTYEAGTTTPQATYTDSNGNVANSNPIVLDAAGRVPYQVWLTAQATYKFILKTSTGVTVWTEDDVPAEVDFATLAASNGSSLIGFLQAGTGAVTRTVQSKLRDVVSVKDFGAVGDGVADDTAAIQAAIDWVVYRNQASSGVSLGAVYIPGGTYKTSDTIQLGYGESFHSVLIYGDGKRYRTQSGFAGTGIVPTFNDRPAFAVNGGRNTKIRGLSIMGKNYTWISSRNLGAFTTPALNDLVASNWVDSSFPASASSRYAPYCAVAIDPYAGVAPATAYPNVTFPSWSGITTQYGKVPSSNTELEDVSISGFVVGVANQPSNADANADYTKLSHVDIECCQYAVSIGNTQSRLVHLRDCVITQVYTAIVTGINGKQLGKPSILVDNTEIGQVIYWMNVPTMSYGNGLTFRNCYGEVIYSLGFGSTPAAANSAVVFDACEFNFQSWDFRGIPANIFSHQGGADFRDCSFTQGGATAVNFFSIDVQPENLGIENCVVNAGGSATKLYEKCGINATGGIVVSYGYTNLAKFSVRTMYHYNLNTGSSIGARNINQTATISSRRTGFHIYAKQVQCAESYTNDPGFFFKSSPDPIDKTAIASISTSGKTVTADLTGAISGAWQLQQMGGDVGDVVWDDETKTTFVVSSRTGNVITLIAQNNLDVNGNLITAPTKTLYFWGINCRMYTPLYVTFGDISTASATVSNFQRPDGFAGYINNANDGVQTGDFVFAGNGAAINKFTPSNANITAIGANSITVASNGSYTATRQRMDMFVRQSPANNT